MKLNYLSSKGFYTDEADLGHKLPSLFFASPFSMLSIYIPRLYLYSEPLHNCIMIYSVSRYVIIRYFVSPLYTARSSCACFPSLSIVLRISSLRGVILHLKGLGLMFNPSLLKSALLHCTWGHIRVVKNVYWYLFSTCIQGLLDVECPKHTSYTDECSLFSKSLPSTNSSSPAKCHVPPFVREWS